MFRRSSKRWTGELASRTPPASPSWWSIRVATAAPYWRARMRVRSRSASFTATATPIPIRLLRTCSPSSSGGASSPLDTTAIKGRFFSGVIRMSSSTRHDRGRAITRGVRLFSRSTITR
jgi:hypothetical protein